MPSLNLSNYKKNMYSQGGEDGVIDKIFDIIDNTNNWCVEFGAADGQWLSNTKNLIKNKRYSAVLLEGDINKYRDIKKYYLSNHDVIIINKYINITNNSIDTLLSTTPIPTDFDFLSIDIDGNDYHIWESLKNYKPKVICIEFNPTIPNEVYFIQPYDPKQSACSGIRFLTMFVFEYITGCKSLTITFGL